MSIFDKFAFCKNVTWTECYYNDISIDIISTLFLAIYSLVLYEDNPEKCYNIKPISLILVI